MTTAAGLWKRPMQIGAKGDSLLEGHVADRSATLMAANMLQSK